MSNFSRPHGLQPTRLLRPSDFPGKSTGVGCHCLLRNSCYTCYYKHFMASGLNFSPMTAFTSVSKHSLLIYGIFLWKKLVNGHISIIPIKYKNDLFFWSFLPKKILEGKIQGTRYRLWTSPLFPTPHSQLKLNTPSHVALG